VTAAVSLLQRSRLLRWHRAKAEFVAVDWQGFENCWVRIDPSFGRFICWITFSAGAELLGKGVCLIRDVEVRKPDPKPVPRAPTSGADRAEWARQFCRNEKFGGTIDTTNFGTLKDLKPHLVRLSEAANADKPERELLLAAFQFLATTIRNRDAHAYVKGVRDDHFHLVAELFVPCFNLMVSWLPDGPGTLSKWMDDAVHNS
jgi:hypothetical protein